MRPVKIPAKPSDICIPSERPFQNDLLGRQDSAEVLTRILERTKGPCVLAIDAAWGTGKTTFLKMWAKWLHNQGFPAVIFSAWNTDFAQQPFLALSSELNDQLTKYEEASMEDSLKELTQAVAEVGKTVLPKVASLAAGPAGPLAETATNFIVNFLSQSTANGYQAAKEAILNFRNALAGVTSELADCYSDRPLVILIDELDRCRPSYAVNLLEVAKHFFEVDRVFFVLAVNRSELEHSIQALYGAEFDAAGYLRRFIDMDFRLPDPNRERFVDHLLDASGLASCFNPGDQAGQSSTEVDAAKLLLQSFLSTPEFTLRDVQQAAHRLGLVFAALPDDSMYAAVPSVVAIVLRFVNPDMYRRLLVGQVRDEEVADTVLGLESTRALRDNKGGVEIESQIILCLLPIEEQISTFSQIDTPLLRRYRTLANSSRESRSAVPWKVTYAEMIVRKVEFLSAQAYPEYVQQTRDMFRSSIQQLELLSSDSVN